MTKKALAPSESSSEIERPIDPSRFRKLIEEASRDSGGSHDIPRIYHLIRRCLEGEGRSEVRREALDAAINFVESSFDKVSRREAVTFLDFLSRGELLMDSSRLQAVVIRQIDTGLQGITRNLSDLAVLALRRGIGQEYARSWLPKLRPQAEWAAIDVLAELKPFLSEHDYSVSDLVSDVKRLASLPEFEMNVTVRRGKWARVGILAEELLRFRPPMPGILNGDLDTWSERLLIANGGSIQDSVSDSSGGCRRETH